MWLSFASMNVESIKLKDHEIKTWFYWNIYSLEKNEFLKCFDMFTAAFICFCLWVDSWGDKYTPYNVRPGKMGEYNAHLAFLVVYIFPSWKARKHWLYNFFLSDHFWYSFIPYHLITFNKVKYCILSALRNETEIKVKSCVIFLRADMKFSNVIIFNI